MSVFVGDRGMVERAIALLRYCLRYCYRFWCRDDFPSPAWLNRLMPPIIKFKTYSEGTVHGSGIPNIVNPRPISDPTRNNTRQRIHQRCDRSTANTPKASMQGLNLLRKVTFILSVESCPILPASFRCASN